MHGLGQDAKLCFQRQVQRNFSDCISKRGYQDHRPWWVQRSPGGTPDPHAPARDPPVLQGNPLPPASLPTPGVLSGKPPCSPALSQRAGHMVTQLSPGQMPAQQRVPLLGGTARGPRAVPAARRPGSTPQPIQLPRQPHPWLGATQSVGAPGRGRRDESGSAGGRKHSSLPQKALSMP